MVVPDDQSLSIPWHARDIESRHPFTHEGVPLDNHGHLLYLPSAQYAPFMYPDHMARLLRLSKAADGDGEQGERARSEFENLLAEQDRVLREASNYLANDPVAQRIAHIAELREEKVLACLTNLELMCRVVSSNAQDRVYAERITRLSHSIADLTRETMYLRHPFFDLLMKAYCETMRFSSDRAADADLELYVRCTEHFKKTLDRMTEDLIANLHA